MASLITMKGPNAGQHFVLGESTLIGRQPDAGVYLESLAVSRQHARVVHTRGGYYVEDLGSSNGTFVNGQRVSGRVPLTDRDVLQVGPYTLQLRPEPTCDPPGTEPVIRAQVEAFPSNSTLYAHNPAYKLQVVLEIAQHLGQTLELDRLLGMLLEHLLRLFPQAERGLVVVCDRDRLTVPAQCSRHKGEHTDFPFSRTVVRRALDQGVGLLSEDVGSDHNLVLSSTLVSLNLRSFLCVPLIGREGRRLGAIQLDCLRPGQAFSRQDLELLTAVGIQAAVVMENAALHAERLREERLRQELMLARDIQQAFLPTNFDMATGETPVPRPTGETPVPRPELFARVQPAREVSGDLYDFFRLPDGRLGFFVGDVSGKGMPAALFMIAVRTLSRHLAPAAAGPADMLGRLNTALVGDNPTALFVTVVYGIYDGRDGSVLLASGGHPPPLLRRADGRVEGIATPPGFLLGYSPQPKPLIDTRVVLAPGETLVLYTDGLTEAFAPDGKTMFGLERLCEVLAGPHTGLPLRDCAEAVSAAVQRFTGQAELQDDQTLLLLRRR